MKTSVAAEYPVAFGMGYATMYEGSLILRDKALEDALPAPHANKIHDSGASATPLPWEFEAGRMAPDIQAFARGHGGIWVPHGGGAPEGLTELEHAVWGCNVSNPDEMKMASMEVDDELARCSAHGSRS